MIFLFQGCILRFHVNLQGGNVFFSTFFHPHLSMQISKFITPTLDFALLCLGWDWSPVGTLQVMMFQWLGRRGFRGEKLEVSTIKTLRILRIRFFFKLQEFLWYVRRLVKIHDIYIYIYIYVNRCTSISSHDMIAIAAELSAGKEPR